MGRGTFGQVVKCRIKATGELVAVKVTKREPSFHNQSVQEINTLKKVKYMGEIWDNIFFFKKITLKAGISLYITHNNNLKKAEWNR
jgi:serine/threonine protein kinase